jgi:organic radical activating enzyme
VSKQLAVLTDDNRRVLASIEDIVAAKLNKFQGWICNTGVQSLYIDFDGNVWNGNCSGGVGKWLLKANKPAWGHLGNIDQGFSIPTETVICPYKTCGCGSDIVVTKYKNSDAVDFVNTHEVTDQKFENINDITAVKFVHMVPKQILWDIGRQCNYNCSYCWPDVHNTTDPHKSLDTLIKTANYAINNWSNGNPIRWYFGGGEPTLNPDFEPFIQYLNSKNQWTMLVSNGSQGSKYWEKNCDNYNILIFSAHFEFMKKELFIKNVSTIVQSLSLGTKNLTQFIIKLMAKPGIIDQTIELANEINEIILQHNLPRHLLSIEMVPLRGLGAESGNLKTEYTEIELKQILLFNQL